jgi:hypothetical protein
VQDGGAQGLEAAAASVRAIVVVKAHN